MIFPELKKPNGVQVELTRGCNLHCEFCGNRTLPKEKEFMSLYTARAAAKWLSAFDPIRIELAMRGEPTLNPNWLFIVGMIRAACPESQIMITTNGMTLFAKPTLIDSFFNVGGNVVVIDCYNNTYKRYLEKFERFKPFNYYDDCKTFNCFYRHPPDTRAVVLMPDLREMNKIKTTKIITNQCDAVDYDLVAQYGCKRLDGPLEKKCVDPFRMAIVLYDGSLTLCCHDWHAKTVLGNVRYSDPRGYWFNNEKLNAARHLLIHKHRDFGVCRVCDFTGGVRQGFLPKPIDYPLEHSYKVWNDG